MIARTSFSAQAGEFYVLGDIGRNKIAISNDEDSISHGDTLTMWAWVLAF